MTHKEIVNKVMHWCKEKYPNVKVEREKVYKITEEIAGITKPYLKVDIVGKDELENGVFGIECKTINDYKNFRKVATAIGQAYILKNIFGEAYIALEINSSFQEKYKLARYQWLTNINTELGIGIIFVDKIVVLQEAPQRGEAGAKTLFVPMRK